MTRHNSRGQHSPLENKTRSPYKTRVFEWICFEMFSSEVQKSLVYLIHSDLDSSYISKGDLGSCSKSSYKGATLVGQCENTCPACTEL